MEKSPAKRIREEEDDTHQLEEKQTESHQQSPMPHYLRLKIRFAIFNTFDSKISKKDFQKKMDYFHTYGPNGRLNKLIRDAFENDPLFGYLNRCEAAICLRSNENLKQLRFIDDRYSYLDKLINRHYIEFRQCGDIPFTYDELHHISQIIQCTLEHDLGYEIDLPDYIISDDELLP